MMGNDAAQAPVPAFVQATRDLLRTLKDIHIPQGVVRARMEDELPVSGTTHQVMDGGARALLSALADYMGQIPVDNQPLLARLRGKDGTDIGNLLNDIATNPPDLNVRLQELREALTFEGKPLLGVVRNIVLMHSAKGEAGKEAEGGSLLEPPETPDMPKEDGLKRGKRGKHGWRGALGQTPPDEDAIRRAAQSWNKSHGGGHEREFHEEAAEYDRDHHSGKDVDKEVHKEAKEYDDAHRIGGKYDRAIERSAERGLTRGMGFDASRPKGPERQAYEALAGQLADQFAVLDQYVGQRAGRTPG